MWLWLSMAWKTPVVPSAKGGDDSTTGVWKAPDYRAVTWLERAEMAPSPIGLRARTTNR